MESRPRRKILGAKNWKIAIGSESSELITPERKRISKRLRRMWNRKRMAYKAYVRPWPLTPGCTHSERFCTYKCKNLRFLAILSKLSAVTPSQTFTVNSPLAALNIVSAYARTSAKNFRFWRFSQNFLLYAPLQTLTVNSPRGALQVWKILWTWTKKRRWTIRLKNLDFLRSA